jgi:hypothetical protein
VTAAVDAEVEAAAWADTFRIAVMMIRTARARDNDAWWALFTGVTVDRAPLLLKLLSMLGGTARDDAWFDSRLERIGTAEASGELAVLVRDWMRELGL